VLDVWKYCLALRPVAASSLHERVLALAPLTKADLDKLQLKSSHPVLKSFSGFALRVRFIKGFAPQAFEMLRVAVWERMAKAAI
jgi:hypothetical protein